MTLKTWLAIVSIASLMVVGCGSASDDVKPVEAATEASSDPGWPAYGFDHDNSVHNRAEVGISPENVADLKEAWRFEAGGVTGTPVVADGIAYFADWHGNVHAVDSRDGTSVWESNLTTVPISASVAVTEQLVIAGDLEGVLHAVDRGTGQLVWSAPFQPYEAGLFASPVIIEDAIVISSTSPVLGPVAPDFRASVAAFDSETGAELWRLNTDPDEDESGDWVAVWSSPAYDPERGLIYIGTGNTNRALRGSSGVNDQAGRSPDDLPWSDGVLAIDQSSGEVEWFYQLIEADKRRDFDVGASPNLFTIGDRDVVGVGGKSGDYVALDRDTGEPVWEVHLSEGSDIGGVMSTAAVGDESIYVASNGGGPSNAAIFALDSENGTQIWRQAFDDAIIGGSLALANGIIYRGIWDLRKSAGTVVALDASDGTILWSHPLQAPLAGGFSVADGTLYVGYGSGVPPTMTNVDGGVIAFRPT